MHKKPLSINNLQTVVLLGGLGTRLKKQAGNLPKSMSLICGKPFFYYQLKLMRWYGLRNFLFCIGYRGKTIKNYFGDGNRFGISIKYSEDGSKLLGTAGALKKAFSKLQDRFILIYGDSYMDVDYGELVYYYNKEVAPKGKKGLLSIFKNSNRYDKSNIIFKDNRLIKYDKKSFSPKMEYIDYGVSILDKSLISRMPDNKNLDLSQVYSQAIKESKLLGYEVKNRFYEIGTPQSLVEFRRFAEERLLKKRPYIFLDRDGTLNELIFSKQTGQFDSPLKPDQFKLLPGVIKALRIFKKLGYGLIVITNQPAAAKGKVSLYDIYTVNNKLRDELVKSGIYLDDILTCIHHPTGSHFTKEKFLIKDCFCRKPKTGLIDKAFEKFNVKKKASFLIGDSYTDMLAASKAKLKRVFIGNYKCEGCRMLGSARPDFMAKSLFDFASQLDRKRKIYEKNN